MTDPFAAWREAVAGGKPDMHLDEPWCGYFKTRDHKATEKLARGRWPMVACAIWPEGDTLKAERAGQSVPVEWIWPHCARHPISYQTYTDWHATRQWVEEAA